MYLFLIKVTLSFSALCFPCKYIEIHVLLLLRIDKKKKGKKWKVTYPYFSQFSWLFYPMKKLRGFQLRLRYHVRHYLTKDIIMHLFSFSRKNSIIFSYPQIDAKFTCQRINRNVALTNDPSKSSMRRTSHRTTTKKKKRKKKTSCKRYRASTFTTIAKLLL